MYAAYTDTDGSVETWRRRLLEYLRANRDHIDTELKGTGLLCTYPEARGVMQKSTVLFDGFR